MAMVCEVDDLCVRYARSSAPALSGVSLCLQKGERLAVLGASGSGKSTFVRALAGLLPSGTAVEGRVQWPAGHLPMAGRDLGFVFQDPGTSLNPVMTIGEQVAEGARFHLGLGWAAALDRACELLERVRLPDPERLIRAFPHQLSGGQRQRVAIAAAIAARPAVLMADEVTSALDQPVQAEIVELLDGLVREQAMTLVFVTHDIALASSLADRIAVFDGGRLAELGSARSVIDTPASPAARALLAAHMDLATPSLLSASLLAEGIQ